jgi:hypothetical protein
MRAATEEKRGYEDMTIDTTTLTLVDDGAMTWLVDTAELAAALPKYYTLAWATDTEAEITPAFLDAYSHMCSYVGPDADVDDVDDVTSRMRYLPARSVTGFVLRGAIRDAAIAAFAASGAQ